MKLRIFTDGACSGNPGPGGWAALFTLPKENEMFSGNEKETTNNRMELLAVVKALGHALVLGNYEEVEIHSDSAYVVNAIAKHWIDSWKMNGWKTIKGEQVKNNELWNTLAHQLEVARKESIKVTFVKVKGHSGNLFNEMVDERARNEALKAKKKVEARKDVSTL